jgi:hypothetical protein
MNCNQFASPPITEMLVNFDVKHFMSLAATHNKKLPQRRVIAFQISAHVFQEVCLLSEWKNGCLDFTRSEDASDSTNDPEN